MEKKKRRINQEELEFICASRGQDPNKHHKPKGYDTYRLRLSTEEHEMLDRFRAKNHAQRVMSQLLGSTHVRKETEDTNAFKRELLKQQEEIDRLNGILDIRKNTHDVFVYDIVRDSVTTKSETVSISLLSDIHIEETVDSDSVLGLNEYNPTIAQKRLDNYFINLVRLVSHHQAHYNIKKHIIGLLGDVIGGFIHEELRQTNAMTPLAAISFAKSCLMSGFKYLQENLDVESIDIVCVVGNHGRNTDKMQFANMTDTSYEYFLYQDLAELCRLNEYNKISFIIPQSGFAIINLFGKAYMFTHGNLGFSYKGGVGGLIVPFLRYFGKVAPVLKIERIFFGHYHTTIDIAEGVGNGSVKGYDSYAMSKGLAFEKPKQSLVLLNSKRGFTNFQSIYLDD